MSYYNDYDSLVGLLGGGLIVFAIIILAILIVGIIANWKLYKKAGKGGWECIIPFYSYWVLIEIAGLNWWWFLLIIATNIISMFDIESLSTIASLVSVFASFNCYYNIAKKFGKSNGTSVCAGIFSFIFILIFGFSKNEVYDSGISVSANGVFGGNTTNNVNNNYNQNVYPQNNGFGSVHPQNMNNNMNQSTGSVDMNTNNINTQNYSFCGNCGTRLDNNVRFCPNCGKDK